jgi:hypothetical protein
MAKKTKSTKSSKSTKKTMRAAHRKERNTENLVLGKFRPESAVAKLYGLLEKGKEVSDKQVEKVDREVNMRNRLYRLQRHLKKAKAGRIERTDGGYKLRRGKK